MELHTHTNARALTRMHSIAMKDKYYMRIDSSLLLNLPVMTFFPLQLHK